MMRPLASYFICCMQRSGSWLLADALTSTERAGRPEEFYWHVFRSSYLRRWGNPPIGSFADFLEFTFGDGTTKNGVFGAKLHWEELEELCAALAGLRTSRHGASAHELLRQYFPDPKFVYLRREDVVRQAISWWRASQTSSWYHVVGETPAPDVGAVPNWAEIGALEGLLRDGDRRWRAFFCDSGVQPLELTYEDLVADYEGVVSSVLAFLGQWDPDAGPIGAPRLLRQRDDRTETWAREYVEMRRVLWPPEDADYGELEGEWVAEEV